MSSYSSYSYSGERPLIPSGTIIGEYEVFGIIGEGGYGQIYEVIHTTTNRHYGMKTEYLDTKNKGLKKEIEIMKNIQVSYDFPEYIASGRTKEYYYLIMELLGPSLSHFCKILPTRTLSRYTLLHLGVHMVHCIHALHDLGYIHRDVKPGNFLIRPMRAHPVCFIDFGLAKKYVDENGQHLKPRRHPGYTGTYRFASINAHEEKDLSRRDDMYSWFYTMVDLASGRLPWPSTSSYSHDKLTEQTKRDIAPEELGKMLPPEFIEIYNLIKGLEYEDTPDYKEIIRLIKQAIKNQHFTQHKLDWEVCNKKDLAKISFIPLNMDEPAFSDDEARHEKDKSRHDIKKEKKTEGNCCNIY